MAQYRADMIND